MQKHILKTKPPLPRMASNNNNKNINSTADSDYDTTSTLSHPRSSVSSASCSSFSASFKPHNANHAAWEAVLGLPPGKVGLDNFRLLRRLGSGDLGNVYLCQIRGAARGLYAMKVVDREALAIRKKLGRAETERDILRMLDHPFLPTLYADFDASHYSCLVMEFCPGGDLYSARQRQPGKRFSVSSAKFYAAETIVALEYLHMMGIVYRDLKPENVLVREDGHIMLSDFDLSLKCHVIPRLLNRAQTTGPGNGLAMSASCVVGPLQPVLSCFSAANRRMRRSRRGSPTTVTTITECAGHKKIDGQDQDNDDDCDVMTMDGPELVAEPINARSKSFVGTHEYLAPEVISGQGHGSAVDWWTLGVFLYEMLYGRTPFKGENNEKTLINILRKPLTFPRVGVSSAKEFDEVVKVQDLISKLLVKNPKKRIGSLKGSVEIKRHEFFKGVNWALIRSVKPPEIPRDNLVNKQRNNNVNFGANLRRSVPNYVTKLTKKEREEPYQIPHHVDYF